MAHKHPLRRKRFAPYVNFYIVKSLLESILMNPKYYVVFVVIKGVEIDQMLKFKYQRASVPQNCS